jgi:hypothetical protein
MVSIKQDAPFKVAVLRDYNMPTRPPGETNWAIETLTSIESLVHASIPNASVEVFSPVDDGAFPDPSRYNLLIFTGGTEDVTAAMPEAKMEAWVRGTLDLIRSVRATKGASGVKMSGMC